MNGERELPNPALHLPGLRPAGERQYRWADDGLVRRLVVDRMQITITTAELSSDGLVSVSFAARSGSGRGIWRGPEPRPGQVYQVELTLLDGLEPGRNVHASLDETYSLSMMADTIAMNVLVESADPDGFASLSLGSDDLVLAGVVRGRLQSGEWVRACVHFAKVRALAVRRGPIYDFLALRSNENAAQPAVAVGRTGRSLRSLSRSPLNGSIVSRTALATMGEDESPKELYRRAWKYIDAQEFAEAEPPLRRLIDATDPSDPIRLWELHGLLAGVLNSLSRTAEGTDLYRRALAEARRAGDDHSAVGPARYMLANQYLLFGDPRDALAEAEPVPTGVGHIQCLLHSIAAQSLWKLGRRDDAQVAAQQAMDMSPTAERRADMTRDLAHILGAG